MYSDVDLKSVEHAVDSPTQYDSGGTYELARAFSRALNGTTSNVDLFLKVVEGSYKAKPENLEAHLIYDPTKDQTYVFFVPHRRFLETMN